MCAALRGLASCFGGEYGGAVNIEEGHLGRWPLHDGGRYTLPSSTGLKAPKLHKRGYATIDSEERILNGDSGGAEWEVGNRDR